MPITDYTPNMVTGAGGPYTHAAAVTPSDSAALPFRSMALWIGGTGNLAFVTQAGDTVTLSAVPAGSLLSVRADKVKATGTTATLIVALG